MVRSKEIVWKIYDRSDRLIGYMYKEGDKFVLVDLKGNRFKVSEDTTLKQAVKILLSSQSMIA
mgnify:CR=1 FL=1